MRRRRTGELGPTEIMEQAETGQTDIVVEQRRTTEL